MPADDFIKSNVYYSNIILYGSGAPQLWVVDFFCNTVQVLYAVCKELQYVGFFTFQTFNLDNLDILTECREVLLNVRY